MQMSPPPKGTQTMPNPHDEGAVEIGQRVSSSIGTGCDEEGAQLPLVDEGAATVWPLAPVMVSMHSPSFTCRTSLLPPQLPVAQRVTLPGKQLPP